MARASLDFKFSSLLASLDLRLAQSSVADRMARASLDFKFPSLLASLDLRLAQRKRGTNEERYASLNLRLAWKHWNCQLRLAHNQRTAILRAMRTLNGNSVLQSCASEHVNCFNKHDDELPSFSHLANSSHETAILC